MRPQQQQGRLWGFRLIFTLLSNEEKSGDQDKSENEAGVEAENAEGPPKKSQNVDFFMLKLILNSPVDDRNLLEISVFFF